MWMVWKRETHDPTPGADMKENCPFKRIHLTKEYTYLETIPGEDWHEDDIKLVKYVKDMGCAWCTNLEFRILLIQTRYEPIIPDIRSKDNVSNFIFRGIRR